MSAGPAAGCGPVTSTPPPSFGHWLEIGQLEREDIEFFTALVADSA